MTDSQNDTERVDKILVSLWNDIVNRQAGKILFEDTMDILEARTEILNLISQKEQP